MPGPTSPSSPCGWATNRSPPPRSTCKPTWHSNSKPSTGPRHPPASRAATNPPTSSSRSSKHCDYADIPAPRTPARQHRAARYRHNDSVGVMRQACLVPGDVLPPGVEVVLVAVGDHDPGETGEDPGVCHGVHAAGAQPEGGVLLGERAVDVLLLPGRPGPQRGLVEPGDRRGSDQGPDQPHHLR